MAAERRDSADSPVVAGALHRASERIFRGPETPWDARSRFGPPGKLFRRIMRRVLRPLEHRQHEIDAALFDAVRATAGEGAERAPAIDLAGRIVGRQLDDAATPIGSFWLDKREETVRPALLEYASWEPGIATAIQDRLRPTMTFVDVGANIGYFSVLASRLAGDRGRVFAVEPDPQNLELLRANLWRNRCFNAQVLPVAAWSEPGHLSLITMPEGGAGSEVSRDYAPYVDDPRVDEDAIRQVLVPAAKLDDLITPPVHLMKVDTQFTDHQAIRGAAATIAASPQIAIVVEFGHRELARRGEGPEQILAYYRGLGFEISLLDDRGELRPVGDDEIMSIDQPPYLDLLLERPTSD